MAACIAAKSVVSAGIVAKPARAGRVAPKTVAALRPVARPQHVQPAQVSVSQASSMMIWQPINNKVLHCCNQRPAPQPTWLLTCRCHSDVRDLLVPAASFR
jgi:hypothetical protein